MKPCISSDVSLLGYITKLNSPGSRATTCTQDDLDLLQASFELLNIVFNTPPYRGSYQTVQYVTSAPLTNEYADFDGNGYVDSYDATRLAAILSGASPTFYPSSDNTVLLQPENTKKILFTHLTSHIYSVSLYIWFTHQQNSSTPLNHTFITSQARLLDSNIPTPSKLVHLVSISCSQTTATLAGQFVIHALCDYSTTFTALSTINIITTAFVSQEVDPVTYSPNNTTETSWILPNIWQYPAPAFLINNQQSMIDPAQPQSIWLPSYPISQTTSKQNTHLTHIYPPLQIDPTDTDTIVFPSTRTVNPNILCKHYFPILVRPNPINPNAGPYFDSFACPRLLQPNTQNICIQPNAPLYVLESTQYSTPELPLLFPSIPSFDRRDQSYAAKFINFQTTKEAIYIRSQNASFLTSISYTDLLGNRIGAFVFCNNDAPGASAPVRMDVHKDIMTYIIAGVIGGILCLLICMLLCLCGLIRCRTPSFSSTKYTLLQ